MALDFDAERRLRRLERLLEERDASDLQPWQQPLQANRADFLPAPEGGGGFESTAAFLEKGLIVRSPFLPLRKRSNGDLLLLRSAC